MSRLSLHYPNTPRPAGPGPQRPKGPSIQASKHFARSHSHPNSSAAAATIPASKMKAEGDTGMACINGNG